jgi:opacity protein-like surface antigen
MNFVIKKAIVASLATLGLVASASTFAQTEPRMPWRGDFWGYLGASAGESKFRTDCRNTNVFSCDKRDTGFKIYAGGRVNEIMGLEIGYTDFGKVNASGGETQAWAVPITLLAGVPIGERFNVFGKIGGLYARTDIDADPSTIVDRGHKNGWGWTYGAGATFKVAQNFDVRVDWDRYKVDFVGGRRDIDMASAGVQFRF